MGGSGGGCGINRNFRVSSDSGSIVVLLVVMIGEKVMVPLVVAATLWMVVPWGKITDIIGIYGIDSGVGGRG